MKKGFTLVELIIVIAILAIISTVTLISVRGTMQKGRDSRRKSDLVNLQKALELYYSDNNVYPNTLTAGSPLCHPNGCSAQQYMASVPRDPNGTTYTYRRSNSPECYQIYAKLENITDYQIITPQTAQCGGLAILSCASPSNTCFGVSSPNVSP